jgi:hypothetical protein
MDTGVECWVADSGANPVAAVVGPASLFYNRWSTSADVVVVVDRCRFTAYVSSTVLLLLLVARKIDGLASQADRKLGACCFFIWWVTWGDDAELAGSG